MKGAILDEFCPVGDDRRKHAILLLNGPRPEARTRRRRFRHPSDGRTPFQALAVFCEVAGYP